MVLKKQAACVAGGVASGVGDDQQTQYQTSNLAVNLWEL